MPKTPDAARLLQVEDVRMCYSPDGKGPLVLDGVNVAIDGRRDRLPARPLGLGQVVAAAHHRRAA